MASPAPPGDLSQLVIASSQPHEVFSTLAGLCPSAFRVQDRVNFQSIESGLQGRFDGIFLVGHGVEGGGVRLGEADEMWTCSADLAWYRTHLAPLAKPSVTLGFLGCKSGSSGPVSEASMGLIGAAMLAGNRDIVACTVVATSQVLNVGNVAQGHGQWRPCEAPKDLLAWLPSELLTQVEVRREELPPDERALAPLAGLVDPGRLSVESLQALWDCDAEVLQQSTTTQRRPTATALVCHHGARWHLTWYAIRDNRNGTFVVDVRAGSGSGPPSQRFKAKVR